LKARIQRLARPKPRKESQTINQISVEVKHNRTLGIGFQAWRG
jgi:hypothetical protein